MQVDWSPKTIINTVNSCFSFHIPNKIFTMSQPAVSAPPAQCLENFFVFTMRKEAKKMKMKCKIIFP